MYLDEFAKGGGWNNPSCCACRQPIFEGDRTMRVQFDSDPSGAKGLTGEYHAACGRPFASLAHVANMNFWSR